MYSNIVVGAHKSETARRAVDEATQLARALDAHVHLVAAYPKDSGPIDGKDTPGRADAQRTMDAMVPPAASDKYTTHALPGDPAKRLASTSYVERQNLTMRMGMRRFTRLTNAFSKKIENHAHAVALHFLFYNFARPHQTLGKNTTPAMAAGIESHPWSLTQLCELLED